MLAQIIHFLGTHRCVFILRNLCLHMDDIEKHRMAVREFLSRAPFNKVHISNENLDLFSAALTHDSFTDEATKLPIPRQIESYERLEFLGDSVVELVACEHVFLNTDLREGPMTDFKQEIVANRKISEKILAHSIDIDSVMLVGHGHRDGKKNRIEENMRADSFEALIGAFYLVYGLDEARRIVREILII